MILTILYLSGGESKEVSITFLWLKRYLVGYTDLPCHMSEQCSCYVALL